MLNTREDITIRRINALTITIADLLELEEFKKALLINRAAITTYPNSYSLQILLANVLLEYFQSSQQRDEDLLEPARIAATRALELAVDNTDHYSAYYLRAMINAPKGDYHQIIADTTKALDLNADNASPYTLRVMRANAYFQLKRYNEALDDFNYINPLDDSNEFHEVYSGEFTYLTTLFSYAKTNYHLGLLDDAIKCHEKAIKLPDAYCAIESISISYAECLKSRAQLFLKQGNVVKAYPDERKAYELAKKYQALPLETLAKFFILKNLARVEKKTSAHHFTDRTSEALKYTGISPETIKTEYQITHKRQRPSIFFAQTENNQNATEEERSTKRFKKE